MNRYGLIGYSLKHSFSKAYFTKKFDDQCITGQYDLFEISTAQGMMKLWQEINELKGLNVTIPYKEEVIPLLDRLDRSAERVGAVNTIKREGEELVGYNTDFPGFRDSLSDWLPKNQTYEALVLGTGGASKAVLIALDELEIPNKQVSRTSGDYRYDDLNADPSIMEGYNLIINTTPLGTYPDVQQKPDLPYAHISPPCFIYDLVYNPEETAFMKEGLAKGAQVKNGLDMLQRQAELAWEIWNR